MKKLNLKKYTDFALEEALKLLSVDSPTGYTKDVADLVVKEFSALGYKPERTVKGGILIKLAGGEAVKSAKAKSKAKATPKGGLLLEAHADTLGGMVKTIKGDGRLEITPLGGMNPNNAETENVRVVTKSSGIYEGTCQLVNASIHVNMEYSETQRKWSTVEIVLDEKVKSKEDTEKLGIAVGDIVCFEPRTRITKSGYIKSRFLDDKLSVAILIAYAKYLKEEKVSVDRDVWAYVTVYEEVGHGGSGSVPAGITEGISVDMGCVGEGLTCTERQVSICAKDSGGPYNYEVVKALTEAAKKTGADYAVDIYPGYGSDVEATLRAGHDIIHGLIGPGVYASHGYERSHRDGVENTLRLLVGYTV